MKERCVCILPFYSLLKTCCFFLNIFFQYADQNTFEKSTGVLQFFEIRDRDNSDR